MPNEILTRHPLFLPGVRTHQATDDQTDRRLIVTEVARLRLIEAQSYRQRDIDAATFARILRDGRVDGTRSIRVRIGRSIIRLGERLASEPSLRPARPR